MLTQRKTACRSSSRRVGKKKEKKKKAKSIDLEDQKEKPQTSHSAHVQGKLVSVYESVRDS